MIVIVRILVMMIIIIMIRSLACREPETGGGDNLLPSRESQDSAFVH